MRRLVGLVLGAISIVAVPAGAAAQPQGASPAPAAAATALDPASLALAHQIVTIGFPPQTRSQMYASVLDAISEQTRKNLLSKMTSGDKGLDAIVDRSLRRMDEQMKATIDVSIPDYFDAFTRAYARGFSHDDLEAILAFVKTPAGQRFFQRSPMLIRDPDVQAASARIQAQLIAKLPELQRQTMQEVEDYVATREKQAKLVKKPPVS